jgi:predicted nuclease of predicted toxin-antitoxin system
LRFLIDAQLPPKLAIALHTAGHEAEHVFEAGLLVAPDIEIWRYAERVGAVIVTKDSDFAAMRMHATGGPAVVWLRSGNAANEMVTGALITALLEIAAAIEAGERLVEIVWLTPVRTSGAIAFKMLQSGY